MKVNFIIFIIPYILHTIVTYYQINRTLYNKTIYEKPLKDIIHENSPDLTSLKYKNLDSFFIIFFLPYLQTNGINAAIYLFKIMSVIVLIRTISSTITDMPSSNPNCKTYFNFHSIQTYITGHCLDKIFSGHTAATLLLVIVAHRYNLIKDSSLLYWFIAQIIYVYLGLICTRHHYSVDVFLSYIIVPLVYNLIKNDI